MTSPSASRPVHDPSDPPRDLDAVRVDGAPPEEAVSLADLIADAGPLPPDAALECVQRLAERLTLTPRVSCASLGPSDVLIDDDGGVWLRSGHDGRADGPRNAPPQGMDRLGHLLAFLATGNGGHLDDASTVDASELPEPLSAVATRLFSSNGACYGSYAELANEAAVLRGVASPVSGLAETVEFDRPVEVLKTETAVPSVAEAVREEAVSETAPDPAASEEQTSKEPGSAFGIALILAAAGGAVVAYFLWQAL